MTPSRIICTAYINSIRNCLAINIIISGNNKLIINIKTNGRLSSSPITKNNTPAKTGESYTVQTGETLYAISKKINIGIVFFTIIFDTLGIIYRFPYFLGIQSGVFIPR